MLDIINRHGHGYVGVPVIVALREKGFFEMLSSASEEGSVENTTDGVSLEALVQKLQANSGHLAVALRMLCSMGWIQEINNDDQQATTTPSSPSYALTTLGAKLYKLVPFGMAELYQEPDFAKNWLLHGEHMDFFETLWKESTNHKWKIPLEEEFITDFLDGVLLIPIYLALREINGQLLMDDPSIHLKSRQIVDQLWSAKAWGQRQEKNGSFVYSNVGKYMMDRLFSTATIASYRPMLSQMPDLLFGDAEAVFQENAETGESHVDRVLNVVGSGFQHKKYFTDMVKILKILFDNERFDQQPLYVADMGCGDGTLLLDIYRFVRQETARGRVMDEHPIKLIGVDYNKAALDETAKTMDKGGVGAENVILLKGDIGDPQQMLTDLEDQHGIYGKDILHVRSFLDHDAPFIHPKNEEALSYRRKNNTLTYSGVYVDKQGQKIDPAVIVQGLIEHLQRWAGVVSTQHGLLMLEVHCLSPAEVSKSISEAESLHFDAYHAFSRQLLVEADVFLLAAAEAQLFPKKGFGKGYPQHLPFTRITLNLFEKKEFSIRHANESDVAALLELEEMCWQPQMRASEKTIRKRVHGPFDTLVLELASAENGSQGLVVGVLYTQRVESTDRLRAVSFEDLDSLQRKHGEVLQLLGMNVNPKYQDRFLGDELLDFALHVSALKGSVKSIAGVTRCRDFKHHKESMSVETYVNKVDKAGNRIDPNLRFHQYHGANILGVVKNYRTDDTDNDSSGVLIEYKFGDERRLPPLRGSDTKSERPRPQKESTSHPAHIRPERQQEVSKVLEESIRAILQHSDKTDYAADSSLMDMGLDSVNLLELRSILEGKLNRSLPSTLFFEYSTPNSLATFLAQNNNNVNKNHIKSSSAPFQDADADSTTVNVVLDEAIRSILRHSGKTDYDPSSPFMESGLDSVNLLELRAILETKLDLKLQSTIFFEYSTPNELSKFLCEARPMTGVSVQYRQMDSSDGFPPKPLNSAENSDTLPQPQDDAIAVVGMACRYPGGANDLDLYWDLLVNGMEGISSVPQKRKGFDAYEHADPDATIVKSCGFITPNVDEFDASFFKISPREATAMDPQHRLLLELSWETLEHAGIRAEKLSGKRIGVFVGICSHDYETSQAREKNAVNLNSYMTINCASSMAAGRISYYYGLNGPSLSIDTACSSSLAALHTACQSIRSGESVGAFVAGVNLLLAPEACVSFKRAGMLSPDGRCKTFDDSANGYVRGEGCGMLLLKRLSDAQKDNDRILALIPGSAMNQDGSSNGITAPSGLAQQSLHKLALRNAKLSTDDVSFIECHGTGTPLGDPIEVQALQKVYGGNRNGQVAISTVKCNIGHLEAGSGCAGLIKVVLAMQHAHIPKHLHLKKLNHHIDASEFPFKIPVNGLDWRLHAGDKPLVAGVSSFGISGTNVHAFVQEYSEPVKETYSRTKFCMLPVSAKTPKGVRDLAQKWIDWLEKNSSLSTDELLDACYTATVGRTHFPFRRAFVASDPVQLRSELKDFVSSSNELTRCAAGKVAFMFTGQGSQYVNMGKQLYHSEPVFRSTIDECDKILQDLQDLPLLSILYPSGEEEDTALDINETGNAQPALFALEYALAKLWMSWGVAPSVVLGHSLGEYVAACIAGLFTLPDALNLIAIRSRIMQALPLNKGMMASILTDHETVAHRLAEYDGTVVIAAINSPQNVVISGERDKIKTLVSMFDNDGITAIPLKVSHAFHSPLMKPAIEEFRAVLSEVPMSTPTIDLMSNLTGKIGTDEMCSADYWCQHMLNSVLFSESVKNTNLHNKGIVFLEIGPKPTLSNFVKSVTRSTRLCLPSLHPRKEDAYQTLFDCAALLYTNGIEVDWEQVYAGQNRRKVSVPSYAYQKQEFWFVQSDTTGCPPGNPAQKVSVLLGKRIISNGSDLSYQSTIDKNSPHYLEDHVAFGRVVVPATAFLEMLFQVSSSLDASNYQIEDFEIHRALVLDHETTVMTSIEHNTNHVICKISSQSSSADVKSAWTTHSVARLLPKSDNEIPSTPSLDSIKAKCGDVLNVPEFYRFVREHRHLEYGEQFRGLTALWQGENMALGRAKLHDKASTDNVMFHPALLDACLQIFMLAGLRDGTYLPTTIRGINLINPPSSLVWCFVEKNTQLSNEQAVFANIFVFNDDGTISLLIKGLCAVRANPEKLLPKPDTSESLFIVDWEAAGSVSEEDNHLGQTGNWILCANLSQLCLELCQEFVKTNQCCALISDEPHDPQKVHPTSVSPKFCHFHVEKSISTTLLQLQKEKPSMFREGIDGMIFLFDPEPCHDSIPSEEMNLSVTTSCAELLEVVKFMQSSQWSTRLFIITNSAQPVKKGLRPQNIELGPIWGMARCIALEQPRLQCKCIDVDSSELDPSSELGAQLLSELCRKEVEPEVGLREEKRFVPRLTRYEQHLSNRAEPLRIPKGSEGYQVKLSSFGVFENLYLAPMSRPIPAANEVEIEVLASGLNFRDILRALGMLREHEQHLGFTTPEATCFGFECAGRVKSVGKNVDNVCVGDEVMAGFVSSGMNRYVCAPHQFVCRKPKNLTFSEIATIPLAFVTTIYGLKHLAKLQSGQKILIHAASGGVGQAAVQWANFVGAEVYATASPAKWDYLRQMGVKHIMNSRTLDFADEISELTNGCGVDVVLNSLNGECIDKSLSVLDKGGAFVEIGKIGIWSSEKMRQVRDDVRYFPFDLGVVADRDPSLVSDMLHETMKMLSTGRLKPLATKIFPINNVSEAFRYMSQTKQIGKICVSHPQTSTNDDQLLGFSVDGTCLITGGLGGLGLAVAEDLVHKGVQSVVLLGRRKPSTEANVKLEKLRSFGAKVLVANADITDSRALEKVLTQIREEMPPLKGIFHTAGIVRDALLSNQTVESFQAVILPKVQGTWNLHRAVQRSNLDVFVCFSSMTAVMGRVGQANYAAANSFMDAFSHFCNVPGQSTISINWGAWSEVGMAAKMNAAGQRRLEHDGCKLISRSFGIHLLGTILRSQPKQVLAASVDWVQYSTQTGSTLNPLYSRLLKTDEKRPATNLKETIEEEVPSHFHFSNRDQLLAHVKSLVANVLALSSASLDPDEKFSDLGMDSLLSVELRNRIQSTLQCKLSSTLIFDHPTVNALTDFLLGVVERAVDASQELGIDASFQSGEFSGSSHFRRRRSGVSRSLTSAGLEIAANAKSFDAEDGVIIFEYPEDEKKYQDDETRNGHRTNATKTSWSMSAATKNSDVETGQTGFSILAKATLSLGSYLYTGVALMAPAFTVIFATAEIYRAIWPDDGSIPVDCVLLSIFFLVPIMWLVFLLLFLGIVIASKWILIFRLKRNESISLDSWRGRRLSTVRRLMRIAKTLVLDELIHTKFLVWYFRSLGATIGDHVVLGTAAMTDPDVTVIGSWTVINEQAVLVASEISQEKEKEKGSSSSLPEVSPVVLIKGLRIDQKVVVPCNTVVQAGSNLRNAFMARADTDIETGQGHNIPSSQSASKIRKESSTRRYVAQLATDFFGLYFAAVVISIAGYISFHTLSALLETTNIYPITLDDGENLAPLNQIPTALGITLLAVLMPLMYVPFLFLFLGRDVDVSIVVEIIRHASGLNGNGSAVGLIWIILSGCAAMMVWYISCMTLGTISKWVVVGRQTAVGSMSTTSLRGIRRLIASRLLLIVTRRAARAYAGTGGFIFWLRSLGARIGSFSLLGQSWSTFTDPDLLTIGKECDVGQSGEIFCCTWKNPYELWMLQTSIGNHSIVGVGCTMLPGAKLPSSSILTPCSVLSAAEQNSKKNFVYMGGSMVIEATTTSIMSLSSDSIAAVNQYHPQGRPMKRIELVMYWAWALVQPFATLVPIAIVILSTLSLSVAIANRTSLLVAACLSPILYLLFGVGLCIVIILSKWLVVGEQKPGTLAKFWSLYHYRTIYTRAIHFTCVSLSLFDFIAGTPIYNTLLQCLGATVGKGALVYSVEVTDHDLLTIGANAVIHDTAIPHPMWYMDERLKTDQVAIGNGAIVCEKAVMLGGGKVADGGVLPSAAFVM